MATKVKAPARIDPSIYSEEELRQIPLNWVNQYYGAKTGSAKHHAIVDMFNAASSSVRGHQMYYGSKWCACTASASFIGTGLAGGSGSGALCRFAFASCQGMIAKAKKQKIWIEDEHSYKPQAGDVILFAWGGGKSGAKYDTKAVSHHVGLVRYSDDKRVHTLEGNRFSHVGNHTYSLTSGDIRGYITPKYAEYAGSSGGGSNVAISTTETILETEITKNDETQEIIVTFNYVEPTKTIKTACKNVVLRDSEGKAITTIKKKGTKVTVYERQSTRMILNVDKKGTKPRVFSKVKYGKKEGYILEENLAYKTAINSNSQEVLE